MAVELERAQAVREQRRRVRVETKDVGDSLARWCPHVPWPKQRMFLDCEALEVFYGGAAAGGKSDAILMAALEYVHVPRYSALIIRKDMQRLKLSGGLMPRLQEWVGAAGGGAHWNGNDSRMTFPSGASIQYGYLDNANTKFRYGSSEYQFIAFDELTEFPEEDYLFLFSRLRKTVDILVPLRMRSASNPGGLGHHWVKNRFITKEAEKALQAGKTSIYWKDKAAFIPAKIADNPAINEKEYIVNLMHLPPITRERLMNGDWSVQEGSIINPAHLRYYDQRGMQLVPLDGSGQPLPGGLAIDSRECDLFITVDTAGTSKQKEAERKGKPASWSVAEAWNYSRDHGFLFCRDVWRDKVGYLDLLDAIRAMAQKWNCRVYIESAHVGPMVTELLQHEIQIEPIPPVTEYMKGQSGMPGKVERATPLLNLMSEGRVFLPRENVTWRPIMEGEMLAWTGLPDEAADQIDCASYAATVIEAGSGARSVPYVPRPPVDPWRAAKLHGMQWGNGNGHKKPL